MAKTYKNIAVLTLIGLLSAACLSLVYREVEPRVAEHREREQAKAVLSVVPGGENFSVHQANGVPFFRVLDAAGSLAGYALPGSGNGYGGEIRLMVGLDPEKKTVTGLMILENIETPGLGGRISEPSFRERFTGLDPRKGIRSVRAPAPGAAEVQAITGATVSSQAVAEIVSRTVREFYEAQNGNQ